VVSTVTYRKPQNLNGNTPAKVQQLSEPEMAQAYREDDDAALHQPLLGNSIRANASSTAKEGKAQLASSIGNLSNTILGTGMLS
jgi:hypothetical protein